MTTYPFFALQLLQANPEIPLFTRQMYPARLPKHTFERSNENP